MARLIRLSSLFVAGALGAAAASAGTAGPPAGRGAVEVKSLTGLPAPIREQLAEQFGEISDLGGSFNPGCVALKGVPRHRFVRGALAEGHAEVAVEHGGIAHYVETLEFDNAQGRWKAAHGRTGAGAAPTAQSK